AVTQQTHSREAVASLLWPEKPKDVARQNLRDVLTKLRPLFGNFLVAEHQTITFDRESSYWLDASVLEQAVARGQLVTTRELEAACQLVRGEFLTDFFVEDSNEFEAWVTEQRRKYSLLTERAFALLLQRLITQANYPAAIDAAQRLLNFDPLHDEGNKQLIMLLARTEQRVAALQHYERYTQCLADELGIQPSAELVELGSQLRQRGGNKEELTGIRAPAAPALPLATAGVTSPLPAARSNLPRMFTPFLGRKEELVALEERLVSPHFSLITIVGEGGMGKSRLALAASEAVLSHFDDGVWFVPLAETLPDVAAESRIAAAIGRAVNLPLRSSESVLAQLFTYLRQRHALLILDNFEHLMASSAFILELLRAAPQLKLLVTSRHRLNFQFESVLRLGGLEVPPINLPSQNIADSLQAYDSVALFVERAQRISWRFVLSDNNALPVARICRYVEGMPLAIELAASLLERLSAHEISRRLETDYQLLENSLLDLSPRQRSIKALLEYSWQFLSSLEQRTLARCSIFWGGFSIAAANHVADASEQVLHLLEQKSLLRLNEVGRFDLHELVRQHALEHLRNQFEEEDAILLRHSQYFSNLLAEHSATLGNDAATFQQLSHEMANLQQAWNYAVSSAQFSLIRQSRQPFFSFYKLSGLFYEAEALLRQAIARVRLILDSSEYESPLQWQELLAELLIDLANVCEVLGKLDEAESLTAEAISLGEQSENRALLAQAYLRSSANAWARGDYPMHRQMLNLSLDFAHATKQSLIEASALCGLGNNDAMHDRLEQALNYYELSLTIARQNGFRQLENMLVSNAGVLQQLRGDFIDARSNFLHSLEVSQALGDRYGIALAYTNLGVLFNVLGLHQSALEQLSQALKLFREIGSQRMEADLLVNLALTYHYLGDQVQSVDYTNQALGQVENQNFQHIITPAYLNLGRALEALGHVDEARSAYQKVAESQTLDGPANDRIVAQCGLARLALQAARPLEAKTHIEEILLRLSPGLFAAGNADDLDPTVANQELYAGLDETTVYLTAYRVLTLNQDQRALALLRKGIEALQRQVEKIDDPSLRRQFVEQAAPRKEMIELANEVLSVEFQY
ncbi:MAG: tetratricopeptide repeat protein, partial [Caldilineaceae bacterium]